MSGVPARPADTASGPWDPLRQAGFRAMWLAILASNIGTWVNSVATAWVMAEKSGSALMVAAVQSAATLPLVLFALIAGALADIVDRRRYLIAVQVWMVLIGGLLAVLAQLGQLGPWPLLVLTFALGAGAAMGMPAQAAIIPDLVPRAQLAAAVSLNSVGMNIARSIGPALGGLILARYSAALAFALNASSFLVLIVVLWRWRGVRATSTLPAESFAGALRAGLRYASHATVFQAVLYKAASFFLFASALTALLPLVVRDQVHAGPASFGVLLGFIGIGAIGGAFALPRLRAVLSRDQLVFAATLTCAATTMAASAVDTILLLCPLMLLNGLGWISVLSSLQVSAQTSVPGWVRARALSLYIMVFSLGMALGSALWGAVAQRFGTPLALLCAGAAAILSALWARRFRLGDAETLDLSPASHWPQPSMGPEDAHDRGPVLVTVEYRVADADRARFLALLERFGRIRRRDGAVQWGVMDDAEVDGVLLEYFFVPSWLEHLRQHERITADDERLQAELVALHQGAVAPVVRHFVGALAGASPPRVHALRNKELS